MSVLAAVLVLRVGSACGAGSGRPSGSRRCSMGPGCPLRLDHTLAERRHRASTVVKTIGGLPRNLSLSYAGSISVTHSLTSASPTQKSGRFFQTGFCSELASPAQVRLEKPRVFLQRCGRGRGCMKQVLSA